MQISNDKSTPLYLGIDGGGSKCKAVLMNEQNEILGVGLAGPANPTHSFEQAIDSIVKAAQLALADANLPKETLSQLIAGVGLAGVNLPKYFQKVDQWQHPFAAMHLTTDLHIACLGAHQGQDGAVIISGTGSCGYALVDGKQLMIGAHGFPQGDKGSGAWIGLQAVQQSLKALDGLTADSELPALVSTQLDCTDDVSLVEEVAGKNANYYAKLAGLVFAAAAKGDPLATGIIKDGAAYISAVAKRLMQVNPPRISMIGGLTALYTDWLDEQVANQIQPAQQPPEIGAVLFAHQQLQQRQANRAR
ncbi:ATPase [Neiella marina]|uniref:ATPase n=1 Tax=Neiella holothuriorum TaxID=2870530 RepID=A0ABS7ECG0_9GAMM|nr:BadF/BadG/BcrA/BcrD ATPase family protein [Neiella holothuriorum]MBW8189427.1 ATPase [Neiella holothuriorum]